MLAAEDFPAKEYIWINYVLALIELFLNKTGISSNYVNLYMKYVTMGTTFIPIRIKKKN